MNYWQRLWSILRIRYIHAFTLGLLAILVALLSFNLPCENTWSCDSKPAKLSRGLPNS
ncbi:MAG: hypothetical protein NZ651_06360 [Candidatus Bipolaricaulota bacterium]|nr:hypothetical protein [Candidatus Bipolaricaulota bacterium]MDW8127377.1 hypothetical protein [Candidatus Bipolaricaulota bacterium]